ncbi:hypothetical protein V7S43_016001 [Phytophthora oleae]|uniref:Uncharacterized protein n=1 Tax=Phytophthora oleae TaxID=2107226 RepID=A0ABD3EX45_9STRA
MVDLSVADAARPSRKPVEVSSHGDVDDAYVKREFDISSNDSEDHEALQEEESEEEKEKAPMKIKLNPKTKKVGRPKHVKKKIASAEKVDRKWYDKAEAGRKAAGEKTLEDLLRTLAESNLVCWRLSGGSLG